MSVLAFQGFLAVNPLYSTVFDVCLTELCELWLNQFVCLFWTYGGLSLSVCELSSEGL